MSNSPRAEEPHKISKPNSDLADSTKASISQMKDIKIPFVKQTKESQEMSKDFYINPKRPLQKDDNAAIKIEAESNEQGRLIPRPQINENHSVRDEPQSQSRSNLDYIPNHLLVQFKESQFELTERGYKRFSISDVIFSNKQLKSMFSHFGVEYISRTFDVDQTLSDASKVYSQKDYAKLKEGVMTHLQHRYLLVLNPDHDVHPLFEALKGLDIVKTVSLDEFYALKQVSGDLANDPFLRFQYNLSQINVEPVWASGTTNANQVIVAVLDSTNFDRNFRDYRLNITGYDDAFIGDVLEPCIVNNDHHGNATVSIMGAVGDNNYGMSGVFQRGKIHTWNLGFIDGEGFCRQCSSVTEVGMALSVSNGAKIINRSFWLSPSSLDWYDPITPALPNTFIMTAASNENCNFDDQAPRDIRNITAYAELPNAILVGGTNSDRERWQEYETDENGNLILDRGNPIPLECDAGLDHPARGSNYGSIVEIFAPGKEVPIYRPGLPNNFYSTGDGTSFSTPQVAGAVALAWSICPGLSAPQMKGLLLEYGRTDDENLPILDVNGLVNSVKAIRNGNANGYRNLALDLRNDIDTNDSDNDGIINSCDNCPDIRNPNQDNDDGDAYGDVCDPEPAQAGRFVVDPADRDADGVLNEDDNCPDLFNPDQSDFDGFVHGRAYGDGIGDVCDLCSFTYNEHQLDMDGDYRGNECDDDTDGDGINNNVDDDDDNDGINDDEDNCRFTPNIDQEDGDGDNYGDICDFDLDNDTFVNFEDNCPLVPNPGQEDLDLDNIGDVCDDDSDNDGIPDIVDLCPIIPNRDQVDIDGDNIGDVCDGDRDGDGILNEQDNCPNIPNPLQIDTDEDTYGNECDLDDDGDGINDLLDNCPLLPNEDLADLDLDGLGDICDTDRDGDGSDNLEDCAPDDFNNHTNLAGYEDADEDNIPNTAVPTIVCCDGTENGPHGLRSQGYTINNNNGVVDNCPGINSQNQDDFDRDGEGDLCDNDDDDDLIGDEFDNCPLIPNPSQDDLDLDGVGDDCDLDLDGDDISNNEDNCPRAFNPDQTDINRNETGDACENMNDRDGDGIENNEDNCPDIPNPVQENQDGDAFGDACDLCINVASDNNQDRDRDGIGNACDLDGDNDGVNDDEDNCPNAFNPIPEWTDIQLDFDEDGFGDACDYDDDNDGVNDRDDNCPYLFNPGSQDVRLVCNDVNDPRIAEYPDRDNDNVLNDRDNCPNNPNRDQLDSDGDLVGDACDNCPAISNHFSQLNDLNCDSPDRDGDGVSNENDVCPNHFDPDQVAEFFEGRWIGQVCEPEEYRIALFENFMNQNF